MSRVRHRFRIYSFLMAQFLLIFMINGTIMILLISRFLMETSLDVHHVAFTYLSLFISLEFFKRKRFQLSEQSRTAKLLKQGCRIHKLRKAFF